jgi:hypothetical protein
VVEETPKAADESNKMSTGRRRALVMAAADDQPPHLELLAGRHVLVTLRAMERSKHALLKTFNIALLLLIWSSLQSF